MAQPTWPPAAPTPVAAAPAWAAPVPPPPFPAPDVQAASPAPAWPANTAPFTTPPPVYVPSSQPAPVVAKPFGILLVTVVEIVIAAVGVVVAIGLFQWVNYGINYEDTGEIPLDLAAGVAYMAVSVALFGVARGLWSIQSWAWTRACLLNLAFLGLIIVSVVPWGLDLQDVIGIAANLSVLVYLIMTPTQQLFGRLPATPAPGAQ
jgi:uncharacterized membrane protein (DUF2068 family)